MKLIKKAKSFILNNWPQLILVVGITTLLFAFCFESHIVRAGYSFYSLLKSLEYYLLSFTTKELTPPATSLDYLISAHGNSILNLLPIEFGHFFQNFPAMIRLFINGTFIKNYFASVLNVISVVMLFITIAINISIVIVIIRIKANKYHAGESISITKALNQYQDRKKAIITKLNPVIAAVKNYFKKWLLIFMVLAFAFYMQLFTIALDLIGNYFYLLAEFKIDIVAKGLATMLIDFIPVWISIPLSLRIIAVYMLFDLIRKNRANKKMEKCLKADSDFLDESGNVILISGASRVGKNSLATCLSLIYGQYLLPNKLLSIMCDVERRFPFGNYNSLAKLIDEKIKNNEINNQNDIYALFADIKDERFMYAAGEKIKIWDELTIEDTLNAMRDWCLAYLFYSTANPLSVSNYSIIFNSKINPKDHYFNIDHFNILRESPKEYANRIYNKVINFDYMRLGRKVSNYKASESYVPDVGVYNITEVGKERGSTDSIKVDGKNRNSEKINKCNDKFNERLKIWSHAATIRYQTLFKLIVDEQQDMEINCELRRCCETILTLDRRRIKKKFALKNWFIEQLICKLFLQWYDNYSLKRKEIRQVNTLGNYLLKKIMNKIYLYYIRRVNLYSYSEIKLFSKNGSTESVSSEVIENTLYMINKISYSGRYETTSLKRLFLQQMATSTQQFDKLRSYNSRTPTDDDYTYMRSFLYDETFHIQRKDDD